MAVIAAMAVVIVATEAVIVVTAIEIATPNAAASVPVNLETVVDLAPLALMLSDRSSTLILALNRSTILLPSLLRTQPQPQRLPPPWLRSPLNHRLLIRLVEPMLMSRN